MSMARGFTEKEERLFIKTMLVQSESRKTEALQRFIVKMAREYGAHAYIVDGNVYVIKGKADLYPCVVAHTDTVHDINKNPGIFRDEGGEWWMGDLSTHTVNEKTGRSSYLQIGIGGDDKCGVYIGLTMIRILKHIKGFFPRDEEIGCVGASVADMDFFKDVSLVIENDRRGTGDFVTNITGTELSSEEFQAAALPIAQRYGFKFCGGIMTDVQELKDNGLDVCAVNLSCGYHGAHTSREVVSEHELLLAQDLTLSIIEELGYQKRWEHTHYEGYGIYKRHTYGSRAWMPYNQWERDLESRNWGIPHAKKEEKSDEEEALFSWQDRVRRDNEREEWRKILAEWDRESEGREASDEDLSWLFEGDDEGIPHPESCPFCQAPEEMIWPVPKGEVSCVAWMCTWCDATIVPTDLEDHLLDDETDTSARGKKRQVYISGSFMTVM